MPYAKNLEAATLPSVEKITGKVFVKDNQEDMIARINNNVTAYLMA